MSAGEPASSALRPGLLAGRRIALAGVPTEVEGALARLGAEGTELAVAGSDDEAAGRPAVDGLVYHSTGAFADGGLSGLRRAVDDAWVAVSAVAGAIIERGSGAKLVLVAPAPEAGELAGAARAALENTARTLSVEWARFGITACAVWPGPTTTPEQLGELLGYLLSPAGDYFSGCRFELR